LELRVLERLQQNGIMRGQAVLDFGCGSGTYIITAAKIAGEQGRVYASDKGKEALGELMQKAVPDSLKNMKRRKTPGKLEIYLADDSIDVALLYDVFHSFYILQAEDRPRLPGEIYRIMKPAVFISISVWPNLIEPQTEDELNDADFVLEKGTPRTPIYDNKNLKNTAF